MRLVKRDPQTGYLDNWLWVPKSFMNVEGTKGALSFSFTDAYNKDEVREVRLWKETPDHLLVPRAFWDVSALPFRTVDLRPKEYTRTGVTSRIKLDHRWNEVEGVRELKPTGKTVQKDSIEALLGAVGGTLQLGCVSGDTIVNLNRGGKGFKTTAKELWEHTQPTSGWDPGIPTQIRSKLGDRVGLQPILGVVRRPTKLQMYELQLVNGTTLKLTSDHEVLTPDGYKSINTGLASGDSVVVDGQAPKSRKERPVYKRLAWYSSHPYAHTNGTRKGKQRYTLEEHRAVAEASLNKLSLSDYRQRCRAGRVEGLMFIDPAAFHVHHKDGNHKNNAPSNLEVLSAEEHLAGHRPGAMAIGRGYPTEVKLRSIIKVGLEDAFDIACPAPHNNFIANGVVVHNCGKGKTCITLEFISLLQVPVLIVVPDTQLLQQWQKEIAAMLDVPGGVGLLQGAKNDWRKSVVLTTYHTAGARAEKLPEEVRRWFGLIVWDEGHHVPAPTFAASAEAFYGYRLSLSATPERDDGLHIINEYHIGRTLFQDLTQDVKTEVYFRYTGLEIDEAQPGVDVRDRSGELHMSKVAGYFAKWEERQWTIIEDIDEAISHGRKVLVVSSSEADLANLAARYTFRQNAPGNLYTDVPPPTPAEFGSQLTPLPMTKPERTELEQKLAEVRRRLFRCYAAALVTTPSQEKALLSFEARYVTDLARHDLSKKMESELKKRQKKYIKWLEPQLQNCGLMVFKIKPEVRHKYISTMPVTFAIMKYGKEGLDAEDLDTVLVSTLFSSRNSLQQLIGRPSRMYDDKKKPIVVFYEDIVGPVMGMCKTLRKHLREWPHEMGGPFDYEQVGHPHTRTGPWEQNKTRIFGQ